MKDFKFDTKETEEYYLETFRKYHVAIPNWSSTRTITREDVEIYIKDAENMLQC